MSNLPYKIHDHLTARRRRASLKYPPIEVAEEPQVGEGPLSAKTYPRMPQIVLPMPDSGGGALHDILNKRDSGHTIINENLPLSDLGNIFYTLSENDKGSRRYPSGGAKYPIETYLLASRVEGLERGAYHYNPHSHNLEHLWDIPEHLNLFVSVNEWAENARAVILFTASWWKNNEKYDDFGYLLGLIETGHAAQNILLAATALEISACPLAGFNDDKAAMLLDLDLNIEQPVYTIALG